jgi:hypothetical protein
MAGKDTRLTRKQGGRRLIPELAKKCGAEETRAASG